MHGPAFPLELVMNVRVHKGQAAYFRRLARATKLEIQAYLVGHVVSPSLTVVDEFHYPKKYYSQTTCEVRWFDEDYQVVKKSAEARGKRVVGDCHSHNNWDAVLSPTDYRSHIEEGYRIAGICSIHEGRTRLRFWIAESALPCSVEYV